MAIPDEKIEEVRTAVDLVEVAEDYVQLKQSGSRYMGLCPFHNEDTPSFSVDPDQNLYYCFGCQNGGDAFKFVQEIEGVGFLESVRMLADRYGVPLPEEETDPDLLHVGDEVAQKQLDRLEAVKDERDDEEVQSRLDALSDAIANDENVMPPIIDAVKAYATMEEIMGVLENHHGSYKSSLITA